MDTTHNFKKSYRSFLENIDWRRIDNPELAAHAQRVLADREKRRKNAKLDAAGERLRKMNTIIQRKKVEVVQENKSGDKSLKDWFNKSSGTNPKTGEKVKGWVQIGGPFAGGPCARQPGQTSTPKCGSSKMAGNLSDKEEEKAFKRKNRKDIKSTFLLLDHFLPIPSHIHTLVQDQLGNIKKNTHLRLQRAAAVVQVVILRRMQGTFITKLIKL